MEFTRTQIARLVLGYLKTEKCQIAYDEFLDFYPQLKQNSREKYLTTRVSGLTLTDYLNEYAVIYTIIQGRLERTDYFNRNHNRCSLVDQLLSLLDNGVEISSRASTPVRRCRSPFPSRNLSDAATNTDNLSLPIANSSPNESDHSGASELAVDVEVLTQTLLEHHELHEKLAEAINTVRNTPEASTSQPSVADRTSDELDVAIKMVVQKTTADPIFDQLIGEIIGSFEKSNDEEAEPDQNDCHVKECSQRTPDTSPSKTVSSDSIKSRLRSRNTHAPDSKTSSIEDHNHEAIQSIIAVSTEKQRPSPEPSRNDVIVYDGSLEQYLKVNTTMASSKPDDKLVNSINSSGLLMIRPNNSEKQALAMDKSNPVCETGNLRGSSPQMVLPNMITEQDIMAMPTVIVCDEKGSKTVLPDQQVIVTYPSAVTIPYQQPKRFVSILPQSSDSITLYNSENQTEACTIVKQPKSSKSKSKVTKNRKKKPVPADVLKKQGVKLISESKSEEPKRSTPQSQTQEADKKAGTPKSASHVRALDFSSPTKLFPFSKVVESSAAVTQTGEESGAQKKVEEVPKTEKKTVGSSWDADLRSLIAKTNTEEEVPSRKKEKKAVPWNKGKTKSKKKTEVVVDQLNSTENSARMIEEAMMNTTGLEKDAEHKPPEEPPPKDTPKSPTKNPETKDENTNSEHELEPPSPPKSTTKPKRPKRKCNTDTTTKEITITHIKEIKKLEFLDDNTNKLVLSPSKLNVNKRCLVDVTEASPDEKLVTPEASREPSVAPVSTAKRNITPVLETPLKENVVPKLSGFLSPIASSDTPFTRVFKEQLCGVDIGTIDTPQFPVTPVIPITPGGDGSGYPNRPTDYSSSSSYYQPSETDNKSLEQLMIEECNRLENKPVTPAKAETPPKIESPAKPENNRQVVILNEIRIPPPTPSEMTLTKKLKMLSRNNIAKKNLNLVKPTANAHSDTSSSSSSSSSSETDTSDTSTFTTPVKAEGGANVRYSLRSKSKSENGDVKAGHSDSEAINDIISRVEVTTTLEVVEKKVAEVSQKEKVLAEMEEKRKRIVAELKDDEANASSAKKKQASSTSKPAAKYQRNESGRFLKTRKSKNGKKEKRIRNRSVKPAAEMKETRPESKSVEDVRRELLEEELGQLFHLSSDDEHLQPFQMVETELLENSVSSTPVQEEPEDDFASFEKAWNAMKVVEVPKNLEMISKIANNCNKQRNSRSPTEVDKKVSNKNATDSKPEKSTDKTCDERNKPNKTTNKSCVKPNSNKTNTKKPSNSKHKPQPTKINHKQSKSNPQEAQTLVMGLKQWGIHLIPKNSDKPTSASERDSLEEGEVVSDTDATKKDSKQTRSRSEKSSHRRRKSEQRDRRRVSPRHRRKVASSREKLESVPKKAEPVVSEVPEVIFDHKVYEEETLRIQHDESVACTKSIADYDLGLLNKKVSARVYIETIDREVEKFMSVTPFRMVFEYPTKKTVDKSRKTKPLERLYSELVGKESVGVCNNSSPLDDLYSSDACTNRYQKKERRESEKSTGAKSVEREASKSKNKTVQEPRRSSRIRKSCSTEIETETTCEDTKKIEINENHSVQNKDDDLMNYAIVGSERVENTDDAGGSQDKSTKKRKADDPNSTQQEKKKKTGCQALLKKIDVETFLMQLHGE